MVSNLDLISSLYGLSKWHNLYIYIIVDILFYCNVLNALYSYIFIEWYVNITNTT
jgi:hypothetical protein